MGHTMSSLAALVCCFCLFVLCSAQFPGNGISKTTYACNDPIPAKKWLYQYFGDVIATPGDECANDICDCAAKGSVPAWKIEQGRVYTKMTASTKSGRGLLQSPGNGFGLHCVNVTNHLTTGGMSTAEVEAKFNEKLGDMSSFDSFMDYNAMLYTKDLAGYITKFKTGSVPYYTTTWPYNSTTWTSVFVHVPNTQMVLELCSPSTSLPADFVAASSRGAQRASDSAVEAVLTRAEKADSDSLLWPLAVNRAASAATMAKLDDFYVTGMGATNTANDKGDVKRKCYRWPGASVDVCFYGRADSATKGDFKGDFEKMLNTVHDNILKKTPMCGVDKWFDNHYAIDSRSANTAKIIAYVEKNDITHCCVSSGPWGGVSLHYIFDPTGWGIQLDLGFSTAPSDCKSAYKMSKVRGGERRLLQHSNPACEPGTC